MKIELFKEIYLTSGVQGRTTEHATKPESPEFSEVDQKKSRDLRKLTLEELKEFSEALNQFFNLFNLETKIVYHQENNQLVVQVINKKTGEVIKQIPPEELLEVSKRIHDFIGIFLKIKA